MATLLPACLQAIIMDLEDAWDDADDISESSSVRMERELLDDSNGGGGSSTAFDAPTGPKDPGTLKNRNQSELPLAVVAAVGEDSTTHTGTAAEGSSSSSLNEFEREIRRLTRDADKILESIRQEVQGSGTKSKTPTKKSTYARKAMHERPNITKKNKISTGNQSESTEWSPSSVVTTDDDDDGNYDEDDEMSDEIDRLDSVSAAIRKSLDAKGDTIPTISSSSVNEASANGSLSSSPTTTGLARGATLVTCPTNDATLPNPTPLPALDTSTDPTSTGLGCSVAREENNESAVRERAETVTTTTPASLAARHHPAIPKDASAFTEVPSQGSYESVLLAVSVVWALVLFLLVHAKYSLLDENGVVRLPFPFA